MSHISERLVEATGSRARPASSIVGSVVDCSVKWMQHLSGALALQVFVAVVVVVVLFLNFCTPSAFLAVAGAKEGCRA